MKRLSAARLKTNVCGDNPPCELCGCLGNITCGAETVDKNMLCTLDECMICPCCKKLGIEANKKRWDK